MICHQVVEIVIVEDDPNDAELIQRVLEKHHLANHVIVLRDGAEAVDFFFGKTDEGVTVGRGSLKVILLDLKLPKVSGIEVLERLKSDPQTREIPVVILTSSRQDRDLKAAYELGCNSYVTKPINFDEFAKAIAELGMYWLLLNKPCEAV